MKQSLPLLACLCTLLACDAPKSTKKQIPSTAKKMAHPLIEINDASLFKRTIKGWRPTLYITPNGIIAYTNPLSKNIKPIANTTLNKGRFKTVSTTTLIDKTLVAQIKAYTDHIQGLEGLANPLTKLDSVLPKMSLWFHPDIPYDTATRIMFTVAREGWAPEFVARSKNKKLGFLNFKPATIKQPRSCFAIVSTDGAKAAFFIKEKGTGASCITTNAQSSMPLKALPQVAKQVDGIEPCGSIFLSVPGDMPMGKWAQVLDHSAPLGISKRGFTLTGASKPPVACPKTSVMVKPQAIKAILSRANAAARTPIQLKRDTPVNTLLKSQK